MQGTMKTVGRLRSIYLSDNVIITSRQSTKMFDVLRDMFVFFVFLMRKLDLQSSRLRVSVRVCVCVCVGLSMN